MISRGQVFVRALEPYYDDPPESGGVIGEMKFRWASVDVLDLDEESFRRFVLEHFSRKEPYGTMMFLKNPEGESKPLIKALHPGVVFHLGDIPEDPLTKGLSDE